MYYGTTELYNEGLTVNITSSLQIILSMLTDESLYNSVVPWTFPCNTYLMNIN